MQQKFLLGLMLAVIVLFLPALASAGWTNTGMLILRNEALARGDEAANSSILSLRASSSVKQAVQILSQAAILDSDNSAAHWAYGRAILATGDKALAKDILAPLASKAPENALLYQELLSSLDDDEPQRAIAFYESTPPIQVTRVISDVVALAYLEQAQAEVSAKTDALNKARKLRPDDLYINYYLWSAAMTTGDKDAAAVYAKRLSQFSLKALVPTNDRLSVYAARVIPFLRDKGLWSRDMLLNVTAFLVWQHSESPSTEYLLEQLIERYPSEVDWLFYMAELYHRRGNLSGAEALYQQTLDMAPDYAIAYERLGMTAEAQYIISKAPKDLEKAAMWYERYYNIAPEDPIGLEKLIWANKLLDRPEATGLQEKLTAETDERQIAARMLGVPPDQIELGPDLIKHNRFQDWNHAIPDGWDWATYLGRDADHGLYVAGKDELISEGKAARIISLWGGPMPDGTMTFGEYVGTNFAISDTMYLVSVLYSSQMTNGVGLLFIGDYAHADGFRFVERLLPSTNKQWHTVHFLLHGAAVRTPMTPLLRALGVGDQEFRALDVRPVTVRQTDGSR